MIRIKYSTLLSTVIAIFIINGCSESCPDDVDLGDLSLSETSILFYPSELPSTVVFIDEENMEREYSIEESTGEIHLNYELLCSTEYDKQSSYYIGAYKRAQYTSERERFFIELSFTTDHYAHSDEGFNEVFLIYRQEEIGEGSHLELEFSNRGNPSHDGYEFHANISLNGVSFSKVYESNDNDGYVYYYAQGIGVIAVEEGGHLWVIKK